MAAKKHPKGDALAGQATAEVRSAVALEHIALSMESIEEHLSQISAALGGQNTGKQLIQTLQRIQVALQSRPPR